MRADKALSRATSLAYRYLATRARSRAELLAYLRKKETPEEVATAVIERFAADGYIDDRKFAHDYARYLTGTKGLSRYALGVELRRKGISDDDAGPALDELFSGDGVDEYEVALMAARKKAGPLSGLPDREKARRRLTDFLRRRGFSFDIIRRVLREVM